MNFVIIASARTGSTHLTHLLNAHKDVICHGEIFRPTLNSDRLPLRWDRDKREHRAIAALAELRERDPGAFLLRVFAQNCGCTSVGFKIFSGQNDEVLDTLILDPELGKVVLFRRNVLAVYSSAMIARLTGNRSLKDGSTELGTRPLVEFRSTKFLRFCGNYLGFYRYVFERLGEVQQMPHLINYDEINDPWHFARLITFIGGRKADKPAKARLAKQNSPNILSRFRNPGDAAKFLQQHGLSAWQYEGETSLGPLDEADGPR
jgi:hypothetical protein